ncbi:hypothetical protein HDE_03778 [Halotydeus destructor]|nr:hypothetical protein HDE_03778 [Halotydeus destructor]
MMSSTLAGQPFGISSHVSCQTMQDDTSLTTAQLMSIAFLTTLVLLVISGSLLNRVPWSSSFSIVSNGKSLFRKNSNRSQIVDLMKLGFALLFISMHSVVGSDNPYGPVMVSRLTEALRDTEKVMFQILFSDSLVEVMFLMCGFTAVYTLYPRIARGPVKLGNVLKLLFDKWSRTVPLIMGLIALEFVWPLIGSGPLFKMASDFTVSNCYKYWLLNVLQVGNWSPAIEKLFHSSVDFQLFAMAVPLTLLLTRKPRLGLALSAILTLGSSIYVAYIVQLKQIIPNFVARDASVQKMMQFMDEVHQPTYTHMPAYIIGMLMGYKAITKTRIDLPVKVTKTLKILCGLAFVAAIFGPTIHNTFQLLPKEAVGVYVIGQKLLYICGLFPILLASSKEEARGEKKRPNKDKDDNLAGSDKDVTDRDEYSLVSALCKLTFSLYLMNYYCIRYDFLTSRIPFQAGVYHVQKRFIFSLVLTFLVATLFHLIVIAPFDNLRKKYYSMAITSPEPVADKMAEHDPRGVAKAIQLKEKGA